MSESNIGPNSLFLGWVKEWWETAKQRKSPGEVTYKHAYDSLKSCPQKFIHPSELKILRGFGAKLCERLTKQLQKHCNENGVEMPKTPRKRKRAARLPGEDQDNGFPSATGAPPAQRPRTTARAKKQYVPEYRSGGFAILYILGCQDPNETPGMPKADLEVAAQPYCDASFKVKVGYYTAWNSVNTLLKHELVCKRGRPVERYCLTEEGREVAAKVREVHTSRGIVGVGNESLAGANSYTGNHTTYLDLANFSGTGSDNVLGSRGAIQTARSSNTGSMNGYGALTDYNLGSDNKFRPRTQPRATSGSRPTAPQDVIVLDDDDEDEIAIQDTKQKTESGEFKHVVSNGNTVPNTSALPNITPIRLAPGSFTVELVLDNREVRAKDDRNYMQRELMKRGITPITRPLTLGDFVWVAKCKQPGWLERMGASEPRVNAEGYRDTAGDLVVLDWIVERKRLDDLISSNKDGRYREQKFRLRRSGIKNVVYIVENKDMNADYLKKSEPAVETMLAQLQVVNGYFLKKTKNTDDTVKYLASMTKMLQKMYEGKSLYVIRSKDLTAKNYLPLLKKLRETKPDMSHHIVYPAFASLCSKSEMMTLRDLFLKMLMCTRLLTGEKAIEIQKAWKTPHEFIKAFEDCGPGEEGRRKKINMVADRLDHLYGTKKISRPLSQKLAEIWGDA
ncbi:putative crossover junction endonuclease mus-81 [Cladorrhinum sp. PSN332]|nr:putative crossover junction endonuclease mus-81 [Cladorrhinum sp. PSN332]